MESQSASEASARTLTGGFIRPVERGDLEQLRAFYNYAVVHSDATLDTEEKTAREFEDWFAEHQGRHRAGVYVSDGGSVSGYASLSPFSRRGGYYPLAELSVYLAPECRGRRYGLRLTEWALEEAWRRDFSTVVAFVTATNEAPNRILRNCGFVHTGAIHQAGRKFGKYVDLDIWQTFLREPGSSDRNLEDR